MFEFYEGIMKVETSRTPFIYAGLIAGILNFVMWLFLGSRFLESLEIITSVWWLLFCLIFTFGISMIIALRVQAVQVNKLIWVTGVILIISITSAFLLGFINAYGVSDWGAVAFFGGMALGDLIGLVIGFFVGIWTSPKNFSSNHLFHHLVISVVTSTFLGMLLIIMAILMFAYSEWVKEEPFYPFISVAASYIFLFAPIGILPSITTGFATSIITYVVNWWFNSPRNLFQNRGVG